MSEWKVVELAASVRLVGSKRGTKHPRVAYGVGKSGEPPVAFFAEAGDAFGFCVCKNKMEQKTASSIIVPGRFR